MALPLLAGAFFAFNPLETKWSLRINSLVQLIVLMTIGYFFLEVLDQNSLNYFENWLRLDSLSSLYLLIAGLCSFLTALYSQIYFNKEALSSSV